MNRCLLALGLLGCTGGFVAASHAGEINGTLLITKVLTKMKVALPDYQLRGAPLPIHHEEAAPIDEFSRVVVYLDGPAVSPEKPVTAKLVQKNIEFMPEILVVPLGSTVSFPNEDPVFHNVFSLSKAKQFDLGYYPAGQTRTVKFDKAGIVQVYCHIHRDMNAAILVVPNQYYIQPRKDGTFTLSGIPAGAQHVVVWHKSAGFFRKSVEVPAAGSVQISLTIPVPRAE